MRLSVKQDSRGQRESEPGPERSISSLLEKKNYRVTKWLRLLSNGENNAFQGFRPKAKIDIGYHQMLLKNQRSGSKTVRSFFSFLILKGIIVLKSTSICNLLNKNINFNKNETQSKIENPAYSFRETNLVP